MQCIIFILALVVDEEVSQHFQVQEGLASVVIFAFPPFEHVQFQILLVQRGSLML